jgi:hypothetical protein
MSFIFAPRSLATRSLVTIEVTPYELHRLIRILEDEATKAADDVDQIGYADFLYQRVAALREAAQ